MEKSINIKIIIKESQKMQMDFLGIDYNHYSDKKIAEIWYSNIKDVLIDSKYEMRDVALDNLEKLYKGMKK